MEVGLIAGCCALVALGWWVVRLGLRPLDSIGHTAEAIAAGDLSRRVEPADDRTEVGRLGRALNQMLGQIESAFDERRATENRLRRFVADASHELRTPLTSIRGYAELSAGGRPTDPRTWPSPCAASRMSRPGWACSSTTCCSSPASTRTRPPAPLELAPVDLARLAATRWPTPGLFARPAVALPTGRR